MSAASNILNRIIENDRAAARLRFESGCQCIAEQHFITQLAWHAGCDYAEIEVALDRLGINAAHLVNSPIGHVVLGHAILAPGSPLLPITIN